jgi:hypothetical protein
MLNQKNINCVNINYSIDESYASSHPLSFSSCATHFHCLLPPSPVCNCPEAVVVIVNFLLSDGGGRGQRWDWSVAQTSSPPAPPLGGGAHYREIPMASSTAHPPAQAPAANSSHDPCCRCCRRPPCHLLTLTSTSTLHPPTATALRDGRRCCPRPCLPPRRRLTSTSHPAAATALCDHLCPCLPPRHRSTSRIDVNVAS